MAARYRRALLPIALLALALLLAPLPGGNTRAWQSLENAVHAPLFALLTLVWMAGQGAMSRDRPLPLSRYALAWLMAVAAGAASEAAQRAFGRDAELVDLGNDALGSLAALCALALWRRDPFAARPAGAIAIWAGLSLALLAVAAPVIVSASAYLHRRSQFPVLWQYQSALDLYFLSRPNHETRRIRPDQCDGISNALRVELHGSRYPGITLDEPYPDWRGFDALLIRLANPGNAALELTVRVHDAQHDNHYDDRFNRSFTLAQRAVSTLRIPLTEIQRAPETRELDLSHVAGITVFSADVVEPSAFCLISVTLAR